MSFIDGINFQEFLSELLNIRGIQTNPKSWDPSVVVPVVELSQGGFAKGGATINAGSALTIAAMASRTVTVLSTSVGLPPDDFRTRRIHAASSQVSFQAAGMTAFNGKLFQVKWFIEPNGVPASRVNVYTSPEVTVVDRGVNRNYDFPVDLGAWCGYVPYDCNVTHEIQSLDGTNFPAGTFFQQATQSTIKKRGSGLPR